MLSPEQLKIKTVSETKEKGVYNIGPLPKGYGHTLGNTFRRVLLSSIMGAAPTKVSIKGANHEFSIIKGIKQDTFTILLNIKDIRFNVKADNFDEVKLSLKSKGVGAVKASDISLPAGVEVANPDLVICEIADKNVTFDADIYVKNGYGYVTSEEAREQEGKLELMYLDRSFSPVKFVNYEVNNTRLGKQTDLDEIHLTVETDGTVLPMEAVKKASAMLREFFGKIAEDTPVVLEEVVVESVEEEAVDEKTAKAKEIQIDELNLPTRTINALKKYNIHNLKDLSEMDEDRLLSVRNLGEKSILEIKKLLKKEGLSN